MNNTSIPSFNPNAFLNISSAEDSIKVQDLNNVTIQGPGVPAPDSMLPPLVQDLDCTIDSINIKGLNTEFTVSCN